MNYDVVVIGGGPAGMAAALSAYKNGASVVILERDVRLGGILNQCIHNGFGLHYFGEELTGPEYANRFIKQIKQTDIKVILEAMVLSLKNNEVTFLSPTDGLVHINTKAIVLAMGCRERTAGAIAVPGSRPVGVYTAGAAQKLCNINGYLVGKRVVILGSGDIGLIMARRMTLEGAEVKMVLELQPFSSGLKRNIVQCLNDFNIPLFYSHTITKIVGYPRVTGLYYAPVDENMNPILSKEKFVECDTLLLSVGLIPENDLLNGTDVSMSYITSGAIVDEFRMTSMKGVFSCGNVLHVHDLVDNVSNEAEIAGESAAKYSKGLLENKCIGYNVSAQNGVRYALPQIVYSGEGKVKVFFRVGAEYRDTRLFVKCGDSVLINKKYQIIAPGEMQFVELEKNKISGDITLELEGI